jgi:hypothetical protein
MPNILKGLLNFRIESNFEGFWSVLLIMDVLSWLLNFSHTL